MAISLQSNSILANQLDRARYLLNPFTLYATRDTSSSPASTSYSLIQCFEIDGDALKPLTSMTIPEALIFKIPKELLENDEAVFNSPAEDHPMDALQMIFEATYTFRNDSLDNHISQTCTRYDHKTNQEESPCANCLNRAIAQSALSNYFSSIQGPRFEQAANVIQQCLASRLASWSPSRPTSARPLTPFSAIKV